MHPIIKNILAVIAGILTGMAVNMALVNIGPMVIPPPEGADITTMEGLKATMHLFKPINFLFPFLGHAAGTLVGAFTAAKIATGPNKMKLALAMGVFFLIGGAMMVQMVPGPTWFNVLDLVAAYIPMGWLGGKWAIGKS